MDFLVFWVLPWKPMASTPDDFQLRNPFFRTPFSDCSRSYWEGVEKTATLSGQSAKTKLPQTLRGLAGCLAKPPRGKRSCSFSSDISGSSRTLEGFIDRFWIHHLRWLNCLPTRLCTMLILKNGIPEDLPLYCSCHNGNLRRNMNTLEVRPRSQLPCKTKDWV